MTRFERLDKGYRARNALERYAPEFLKPDSLGIPASPYGLTDQNLPWGCRRRDPRREDYRKAIVVCAAVTITSLPGLVTRPIQPLPAALLRAAGGSTASLATDLDCDLHAGFHVPRYRADRLMGAGSELNLNRPALARFD